MPLARKHAAAHTGLPSRMVGRKYKPINSRGYDCVNVLIQRAVSKIISKAKARDRASAWHSANKERANLKSGERHQANRSHNLQKMREYHNRNKPAQLELAKIYRAKHREDRNTNDRKRRKDDPVFQLTERCRSALTRFLKHNNTEKTESTSMLLGCSYADLQMNIQNQLNGRDFNDTEIDHIFPFAAFKNQLQSAQQKVMHHSNLQPLTIEENANKRDKLPTKAMAAKVDPSCWPDGVTMDMLPDIYPGWATPLRM